MKTCDFCLVTILESGSQWGEHQDSYEGYKSSATDETCVFCEKIVKEVLGTTKWQSVLSYRDLLRPGRPVYRWTIRKAAKINEIPESFIITFREIPAGVGQKSEERLAGLPDLTFYMLQETGLHFTVCWFGFRILLHSLYSFLIRANL